jgi:hypothetical protein
MNITLIATSVAAGLFGGMLILTELGRRIGAARLARDSDGLAKGVGVVEGAVFGLLGLLLAFTFSGAASRFEARRHLVTSEANAIGTAYLRVDLLPPDAQPEIRDVFRRYVDLRASAYRGSKDFAATQARLDEGVRLQGEIWTKALAACRRPEAPQQAAILLLPALNEMIDITTTRVMATRNHPPLIVFLMLGGLSLVGALLVGYGMSGNKERSWLHTAAFALVMALAIYVILDLEFPRLGMIRVDDADQILVELGKSLG